MVDYVVETLSNAIEFAENDCRAFFARPVFRGQRNAAWTLKANLFRGNQRVPFSVTVDFLGWSKRSPVLSSFTDEVLLQVAQHYGLMTDLLDFTTDPLIACFFALCTGSSAPGATAVEAAVYVVDAEMLDGIESLSTEPHLGEVGEVLAKYRGMYREGQATGLSRLVAQKGVFVRDAHGTLEAILASENEVLGLVYEDRFHQRLNYAKLLLTPSIADVGTLANMGVTRDRLFPPANPLEREVERFLTEYSDRDIAATLKAGLDERSTAVKDE